MRVIPFVTLFLVGITASSGIAGQLSADPANNTWRSAVYHGGSDYEFAQRLAVDRQGNTYLLGRTSSADMHPSVVPVSTASGEPASATFVLKINPDGQTVYATSVGTGFGFLPLDIAIGADGSPHVLTRDGDVAHVLKLEPGGGRTEYHIIFNGLDRDGLYPKAIAVDTAGHAVIAGWSERGIFVARLDARGSVFDIDVIPMQADARDVAVDEAGDAYIVGTIASDVLPSTSGAFQPRYNNAVCTAAGAPGSGSLPRVPCLDVFILKLTRDGQIAYATYFGGSGLDEVHAVIVDRAGAAIIGGLTRSVDLPTARAVQPECKSGFAPLACGDAFIAKLDPRGSSLVFATYLGGTDTEIINSLAVDDAGLVYAAGSITGSGLPVYRAPQSASGGGETDGFVAAFAPQGNLLWATYVGGKESESIVGVGAAAGFVYFGGETTSSSWAIGGAPFHGGRDLFSARVLDPGGR